MQYIILDMEWNQPWPGSYSAKKPLPSPMRGEIVQIGAVRMTQDQQVADEFQILIRPKYFKKMNRKVASLTGIRDSDVAGAPDEKTAMEMFMEFAGDRPLIAHNAHFDVGFMTAAANRQGLRFAPVFMDTLTLAQALLPERPELCVEP